MNEEKQKPSSTMTPEYMNELAFKYIQLKAVVEWHKSNTNLKPDTKNWEEYARDQALLNEVEGELIERHFDKFRTNKVYPDKDIKQEVTKTRAVVVIYTKTSEDIYNYLEGAEVLKEETIKQFVFRTDKPLPFDVSARADHISINGIVVKDRHSYKFQD